MRIVDNLNAHPQSAFTGALIFLGGGLRGLCEVLGGVVDAQRVRFIPVFATGLFLSGALGLFLRGREMQREAKQSELTDAQADSRNA